MKTYEFIGLDSNGSIVLTLKNVPASSNNEAWSFMCKLVELFPHIKQVNYYEE